MGATTARRGLWMALGSVMLMAGWYPAMKVLMGRISPIQAATIEAVGMTAAAAVWSGVRGRAITLKDTRQWATFSLLNAAALALLYLSLAQLSPIVVSLVGRSYVVVCAILGVFVLHERLSVRDWSLIVISTGSTVIFIQGDAERVSPWGVVLSMGYVVCFAFANLLAKRFTSGAAPSTTLFWSRVLAAIVLPVLGLALEGRAFLSLDFRAAAWVLGCSLMTMFAGLWLYYRALGTTSFTLVNVLRALGPIFVFFYSLPLMMHWPSVGQIVAGIVCIVSIAILSLFPQRIAKRTAHSRDLPVTEVEKA